MTTECSFPRVGVGVIILHHGKILLYQRTGSHGSGRWSPPGGHLELFETVADCAKRETKEEVGIEIDTIEYLTYTENFYRDEGKHYLTIFVTAQWVAGEPTILEPDRMRKLDWFSLDALPHPLFLPLEKLTFSSLHISNLLKNIR